MNLLELPESCVWKILSFTTPRDIGRLSAVSKAFKSVAYDDFLWNKFIPQKCYEILPRAVTSLALSSKRELYVRLCESILIDGGTKRFWLEPSTGKVGYMISATEFFIIWGTHPSYWRWVSRHDSRFADLAELVEVCWLDFGGRMDCTLLSEDTEYRVLFVLKFGEQSQGWDARPIKISLSIPDGESMVSEESLMEREGGRLRINGGGWMEGFANDGWMHEWVEVVAGEFTVRADCSSVEFRMREVESNQWKRGLLIDGVRFEPKST